MGKKHGFKGTPVKPAGYSSNAGVFEKRGDPFVSPREGLEGFNRNLETENPDYDRHFARLATDLLKPSQRERRKVKEFHDDPQRRATNAILVMRKAMAAAQGRSEDRNVKDTRGQRVVCPYHCGHTAIDQRAMSYHLRGGCERRKTK